MFCSPLNFKIVIFYSLYKDYLVIISLYIFCWFNFCNRYIIRCIYMWIILLKDKTWFSLNKEFSFLSYSINLAIFCWTFSHIDYYKLNITIPWFFFSYTYINYQNLKINIIISMINKPTFWTPPTILELTCYSKIACFY